MPYKDYLRQRGKTRPESVNQPISGREADMVSASGGAGFAFAVSNRERFKRWLILGSTKGTMYATPQKLTLENLDIAEEILSNDYKFALDTLVETSVENLAPKQDAMLAALALALSYNDRTVRVYNHVDAEPVAVFEIEHDVFIDKVGYDAKEDALYALYNDPSGHNTAVRRFDLATGNHQDMNGTPANIGFYDEIRTDEFIFMVYSKAVRVSAEAAAQKMIRQASQLFELIDNLDGLRGWGRALRKLVSGFYTSRDARTLAYQVTKYGQRSGYTHRDVMRLAHPKTGDKTKNSIFAWSVGKFSALDQVEPDMTRNERGYIADPMSILWASERVKLAKSEKEVIQLVRDYDLPREAVERADTKWLNSRDVWEALLDKMPAGAMVRNLSKMARVGLLTPHSDAERFVAEQLRNAEIIKRSRVHPFRLVQAALMYDADFGGSSGYTSGYGYSRNTQRRSNDYETSAVVLDALNDALEASFANVTPSNKRIVVAVDVSGSMWWEQIPSAMPLTPAEASAVYAMILAKTEPYYQVYAFSDRLRRMNITKNSSIRSAIEEVGKQSMGRTNIGLPVRHAFDNGIQVDGFVSITDNEVNTGDHPSQWMKRYREETGINSRFVTVAMTANGISVADPADSGMMDVVGFSSQAVDVISGFIAHRF